MICKDFFSGKDSKGYTMNRRAGIMSPQKKHGPGSRVRGKSTDPVNESGGKPASFQYIAAKGEHYENITCRSIWQPWY